MFIALDLVQSTIFGGAILLLVLQLNSSLTDSYTEVSSSTITQQNAVDIGTIMTNDIAKMGYMVPSSTPVITYADTMGNMVFKADINTTTPWVDSIKYQVVNPTKGGFFRITRTVNTYTPTKLYVNMDSIAVTYYTSTGVRIPASMLTTQAGRDSIRSMKISMRYADALRSSSTPSADSQGTTSLANSQGTSTISYTPSTMFWEKIIAPRNIQSSL
jgi:hypothetical protein